MTPASPRGLRPTPLLRCVVFVACVLLLLAVWELGAGLGGTALAVLLVFVVWSFGLETGLLPWAIGRTLARGAARRIDRSGGGRSLWFVDVEDERRRELERFHDDSADNPTIR